MKVHKLEKELLTILEEIFENENNVQAIINSVHDDYKLSAKNLFSYLVLRTHDLRKYHNYLTDLGLSSLRTTEGHVLSNLVKIISNLRLIQGKQEKSIIHKTQELIGYKKSKKLLKKHANILFNSSNKKHFTEIMVTLPLEAADDPSIIRSMVENGMEIARINLSHGNKENWLSMVNTINELRNSTKNNIKIFMDLSGPKIRTSNISIINKKGKIKNSIPITNGEHIILTKRKTDGKKSQFGKANEQLTKAEVGVQLHEIINDAKIGDIVLFDDGMIKSKVIAKRNDEIEIVITASYKNKISSKKGINLPNTQLNLPALTKQDMKNLSFVCEYADLVGYSFVRSGEDVSKLYKELEKYNSENIGVIFKIENQEAFENLPDILFTGMQRKNIGVMIARGDLAVEIGFERISEVQNQILWLCEAGHIPVIWATQVLENLAKTGIPTRAEISDASLGAQAECVMLNKGPHINEAIKILKNILIRMEGHTFKKKNELRALNLSKNYLNKIEKVK